MESAVVVNVLKVQAGGDVPGSTLVLPSKGVGNLSSCVSMVALNSTVAFPECLCTTAASQNLNSGHQRLYPGSMANPRVTLSFSSGYNAKNIGGLRTRLYRHQSAAGPRSFRVRCGTADENGDKEKSRSIATEKEIERTESTDPASVPPAPQGGLTNGRIMPHAFSLIELIGPEKVDPEDVKLLKEKVFGYTTFWITGQEPFGDLGLGVQLFGNLRGKREEVFAKLQSRLRQELGTKYNLFMVEEPNALEEDVRGGPRISFVLLRSEVSNSGPTTLWQWVIALVLLVLTGGTSLELGFSAQLSKLPPEIVQYITNPETVEPPDVQSLVPFVDAALPLAYGVFGVQILHELGHRLAAAPRNVKMGLPYFVPNITLGSFGAITQFKSVCPDRKAKFDISMAGPVAGCILSVAMFSVGLLLSTSPETSNEIVKVPSILFQGSLLLGLISREVLGYNAVHSATIGIHPLVIAGWCGLTTTALNLLPVGSLDGGRAMQAAFGKTPLTVGSLVTYLMLGLGLLAGPLALPWVVYVLICQRTPEKPCLNDVTDVGSWRKISLVVALLLVISTLLPIWDELAEEIGLGLISVS